MDLHAVPSRIDMIAAFKTLFDLHPAHVALIDLHGYVLAVNNAWARFGADNNLARNYVFQGTNYLEICASAAAQKYPYAREAYLGVLSVINRNRTRFTLDYPCHAPSEQGWFHMWVEGQQAAWPAIIIAHRRIDPPRTHLSLN